MNFLFKAKPPKQPSHEEAARHTFSRENLFIRCLRDTMRWSPERETLCKWLDALETDPSFTKELEMDGFHRQRFTLTKDTSDYLHVLLDVEYLTDVYKGLLKNGNKDTVTYLLNCSVDVICLLDETHDCLENGVPLQHPRMQTAARTIQRRLQQTLQDYYELQTTRLATEVQISEQFRKEYQGQREELAKRLGEPDRALGIEPESTKTEPGKDEKR